MTIIYDNGNYDYDGDDNEMTLVRIMRPAPASEAPSTYGFSACKRAPTWKYNDDYDDENCDNYDDDSNNDVNDGNNDVNNGDGNFYDGDDDLDDSNHCWLTAWSKCLLDSPIPDNIIAC